MPGKDTARTFGHRIEQNAGILDGSDCDTYVGRTVNCYIDVKICLVTATVRMHEPFH
jgi:hypothetical protein